jgi:hypothetical protein
MVDNLDLHSLQSQTVRLSRAWIQPITICLAFMIVPALRVCLRYFSILRSWPGALSCSTSGAAGVLSFQHFWLCRIAGKKGYKWLNLGCARLFDSSCSEMKWAPSVIWRTKISKY